MHPPAMRRDTAPRPTFRRPTGRAAGFTLLELMVACAIFAVLVLLTYGVVHKHKRLHDTGVTAVELEAAGRRALGIMTDELRQSGADRVAIGETLAGIDLPHAWSQHAATPANTGGRVAPPSRPPVAHGPAPLPVGADRIVAFQLPVAAIGRSLEDPDGRLLPLHAPSGIPAVLWGSRPHANRPGARTGTVGGVIVYRLAGGPDGQGSRLERFDTGTGRTAVLCRHVARVSFQRELAPGAPAAIRIQLALARRTPNGEWTRVRLERIAFPAGVQSLNARSQPDG